MLFWYCDKQCDCVINVMRFCANTNQGHEGGVTQADRAITEMLYMHQRGLFVAT